GVDSRGGGRARAAATAAGGSGPAGAGGGHDLDTRRLGLAGPMDMGTGALGLPAPSLRPLGAGSLVASGRALVLGSGSLGKTVSCGGNGSVGRPRAALLAVYGPTVGGCYFSLTVGQVDTLDAPERIRNGMGQYPIPVVILAGPRKAVATALRGMGQGGSGDRSWGSRWGNGSPDSGGTAAD
ncbi:MAG: hypothetical protein ACYCZC_10560, partial [Acidithiobacillus sp.]